jgi:hypothetical protein
VSWPNWGHVTRARITQILNLLLLAPDIQEQILFLSSTSHGRDPIGLAQLQPITRVLDWNQQRRLWTGLRNLAFPLRSRPGHREDGDRADPGIRQKRTRIIRSQ